MTLANLLTQDNSGLRDVAKHFNQSGYAAPYVALVLLSVLATLAAGYLLWNHRRRQMQQPGSRALLKRLGDMLGLAADHRRLLWKLGRAVELEPAAALVSPAMLIEMVHRIERRGEKLSAEQAAQVAEILDIVATASNA
jgi:hypothetical protein